MAAAARKNADEKNRMHTGEKEEKQTRTGEEADTGDGVRTRKKVEVEAETRGTRREKPEEKRSGRR